LSSLPRKKGGLPVLVGPGGEEKGTLPGKKTFRKKGGKEFDPMTLKEEGSATGGAGRPLKKGKTPVKIVIGKKKNKSLPMFIQRKTGRRFSHRGGEERAPKKEMESEREGARWVKKKPRVCSRAISNSWEKENEQM